MRILRNDPDNDHAHYLLGTVYFNRSSPEINKENKKQRYNKAEQEFLKVLTINPKHCDARWYLAFIYHLQKKYDQKVKQLEAIIAVNPDYECPYESFPEFRQSNISRADLWLESHITHFMVSNRLDNAKIILKNYPDNAHAHYLLGTVYLIRKYNIEKVEEELLKAISLDPNHWDARWYLAVVYYTQGKDPELIKTQLEEIIEGNPDYECTDDAFPRIRYRTIKTLRAYDWLKSFTN